MQSASARESGRTPRRLTLRSTGPIAACRHLGSTSLAQIPARRNGPVNSNVRPHHNSRLRTTSDPNSRESDTFKLGVFRFAPACGQVKKEQACQHVTVVVDGDITLGVSNMAYDLGLAQRVRDALDQRPGISERKMFGGLAFLIEGKMFVGISGSMLMARVGPERYKSALAMPSVCEMDFTGRPMTGYVYVEPPALKEDRDLEAWVTWCFNYVATVPRKPAR